MFVERFEMFINKTQLKTKKKPGYIPRHNFQLAIGNNFIGFLSLCELWLSTGSFYPKRFGMFNVSTFCTRMCEATFWNIKWSETSQRSAYASGVKCIGVCADSTHRGRVVNVVGPDVEAKFSCTCHKHVISTGASWFSIQRMMMVSGGNWVCVWCVVPDLTSYF